jgi:hypothetical protein
MPTTVDARFDEREATTGGRLEKGKFALFAPATVEIKEAEEI